MSVIRRLPRYYRFISELYDRQVDKISSTGLAKIMNVTASQVRQDLNCFGGFGQQGYGYSVALLKDEIEKILGIKNNAHCAVLLGAGNLGRAVAEHMNFEKLGFKLAAIFELDPEKIGTELRGMTVRNESELLGFCAENQVEAAFLCIPKESVKKIIPRLYDTGIRCYWNFSHYDIAAEYPDTIVENVHMSDSLMTLCFRMNDR